MVTASSSTWAFVEALWITVKRWVTKSSNRGNIIGRLFRYRRAPGRDIEPNFGCSDMSLLAQPRTSIARNDTSRPPRFVISQAVMDCLGGVEEKVVREDRARSGQRRTRPSLPFQAAINGGYGHSPRNRTMSSVLRKNGGFGGIIELCHSSVRRSPATQRDLRQVDTSRRLRYAVDGRAGSQTLNKVCTAPIKTKRVRRINVRAAFESFHHHRSTIVTKAGTSSAYRANAQFAEQHR